MKLHSSSKRIPILQSNARLCTAKLGITCSTELENQRQRCGSRGARITVRLHSNGPTAKNSISQYPGLWHCSYKKQPAVYRRRSGGSNNNSSSITGPCGGKAGDIPIRYPIPDRIATAPHQTRTLVTISMTLNLQQVMPSDFPRFWPAIPTMRCDSAMTVYLLLSQWPRAAVNWRASNPLLYHPTNRIEILSLYSAVGLIYCHLVLRDGGPSYPCSAAAAVRMRNLARALET